MKIKRILIRFCILLAVLSYGCKTTESTGTTGKTEPVAENPSILEIYGEYKQGEYINNYYGFQLTIPENFIFQDDETRQYIQSIGAELIAEDENHKKTLEELAEIQTYNILMTTKYELGTPGVENIILQVMAENLKYAPGVQNGSDYLWFIKEQLGSGGITISNESEFDIETINGIEFHTYSYSIEIQSTTINQKWFCKKVDDHALSFAITYATEDGFIELDSILNTIELLENSSMK